MLKMMVVKMMDDAALQRNTERREIVTRPSGIARMPNLDSYDDDCDDEIDHDDDEDRDDAAVDNDDDYVDEEDEDDEDDDAEDVVKRVYSHPVVVRILL